MQNRQRASRPPRKRPIYYATDTEPASPQRAGHSAGLHAEDAPDITTAEVQRSVASRRVYPSQKLTPKSYRYRPSDELDTMIARGDAVEMPDGIMYRSGNTQYYAHAGPPPVPPRARRTAQQQIPQRAASQERNTEPHAAHPRNLRRQFHWLFWVGIALVVMIVGYVGINAFGTWWTNHQNDATYGYPRTFQMNAVVGHGDSPAHPSHFIAVNLNRRILVIEIPGGNISKSIIYAAGELVGNGQDLTPVTLTFQDVNGDRRPDMLVHVSDQPMIFLNNGSRFVQPSNLISGGITPPTTGGNNAAGETPHYSSLL